MGSSASAAPVTAGPERDAKKSKAREFLLVLLQALALLVVLELVMGLTGIGKKLVEESQLLPFQSFARPLFETDGGGDSGTFRANEARLGSQRFVLPKPEGVTRIFCLGGSAMKGLGYSPNVSIPVFLERCLVRAGYPGRRFEVVNCGIVGHSSAQERPICAELLARYDPDLLVVCSGNNEFLRTHAEKYEELHRSGIGASIRRVGAQMVSVRLLKKLVARPKALGPTDSEEVRLTASQFIEEVEVAPAEIADVVAAYRRNLEEIAGACRQAGVPLVLMTVPANLRWNDPFEGEDWVAKAAEKWSLDVPSGSGDGKNGIEALLAALEKRSADASARADELAFVRGKCLEALGRIPAARQAYTASLELDPHLRRTLPAMNEAVREVAAATGALLVDTCAVFQELEPIPDFRFFYDHIHYTPRGALTVALRVAERLREGRVFAAAPPGALDDGKVMEEELAAIEDASRAGEDFADAGKWVGFNFEPAMLADRDLWKYDRAVAALAQLLETWPATESEAKKGKAFTYLGNARSFEAGGQSRARRCYEQALTLVPEWKDTLEKNLARLGDAP